MIIILYTLKNMYTFKTRLYISLDISFTVIS